MSLVAYLLQLGHRLHRMPFHNPSDLRLIQRQQQLLPCSYEERQGGATGGKKKTKKTLKNLLQSPPLTLSFTHSVCLAFCSVILRDESKDDHLLIHLSPG